MCDKNEIDLVQEICSVLSTSMLDEIILQAKIEHLKNIDIKENGVIDEEWYARIFDEVNAAKAELRIQWQALLDL